MLKTASLAAAFPAFFLKDILDDALAVVIYHVHELDTVLIRIFPVLHGSRLEHLAHEIVFIDTSVNEQGEDEPYK
jgi:hypothetical protein